MKLAKAESVNVAWVEEFNNIRATLDSCENKWYNEGFVDAENSADLVIRDSRKLGFEEGWLAALQVLGIPEDSPLRDPGQIPFPDIALTVQNPPRSADEEKMTNLRELVE